QYFGEPISPASCDRAGHCRQFLEKALVTYTQGAASGEAVDRAPLGLWQSHPEDRPEYRRAQAQTAAHTAVRWPLFVAGGIAFIAGVFLLLSQLWQGRMQRGATI